MVYAADKHVRSFLGLISSLKDRALFADPNYEDPSYPVFHIRFLFNVPEKNHPDYVSNNLLLEDDPDSAVNYLRRVAEPERAAMLQQFILSLKKISTEAPWFFQSISGLEKLYKHDYFDTSFQNYGTPPETILNVSTLDSIDFRMHFLKDLFRKSTYDRRFRRWTLPVNMRRFRMQLMVGDFRKMTITEDNFSASPKQIVNVLSDMDIFNTTNAAGKVLGAINDGAIQFSKRLQWWDQHFSCMVFDCQDCEFDMTEFEHDDLSHNNIQALKAKFKIRVGKVIEANTYSLMEYILSDQMFANVLKNDQTVGMLKLTGTSADEEVLKYAKAQEHIFKPTLDYWSNYQALEREKGDNKRLLLENRDIESALGNAVNQGIGLLGEEVSEILGGNTSFFGNIPGDLGIIDFAADTASELVQDALGIGTEEIVRNIFSNEIAGSLANATLGVLNGDLNVVAQNLTNPALLGELGITVEGRNASAPNLVAGIPKNVGLLSPNVQRSLSDVTAALSGEGPDPRFLNIGRPGQSLFTNPDIVNGSLSPTNVELIAPRVETTMPQNVDLQAPRTETQINPNNADLIGSTPKTTFDESNADLNGGGKLTSLNETNANLIGADPLRALNPTNADLTGAEPLKDLVPDNADLTGAEPLKDLVPNNADLNGAEPLKDLVPNNADLTGAEPLKDLVPNNADLNGAEPLKDLVPSNADLTGADPLRDLNPSDANLVGAGALDTLNPNNIGLDGAGAIRDMYQANMDLEAPEVRTDMSPKIIGLDAPRIKNSMDDKTIDFRESKPYDIQVDNVNLDGGDPLRTLAKSNIEFGSEIKPLVESLGTETLNGKQPLTNIAESNVNLTGAEPQRALNPNREELLGKLPLTGAQSTNVGLEGAEPIQIMPAYNAKLTGAPAQQSNDMSNVNLTGKEPQEALGGNVGLTGATSVTALQKSANLTGAQPGANNQGVNVGLTGAAPQETMSANIGLEGRGSTNILEKNVNLTGAQSNYDSRIVNIGLEGQDPVTSIRPSTMDFSGSAGMSQTKEPKLGNVNLGILQSNLLQNSGNVFSNNQQDTTPPPMSLGDVFPDEPEND